MLQTVKTATDQLQIGMYVAELDRPWLGTPFLLQGFRIESEQELQQLRELCDHVFIDVQQSAVLPPPSDPLKSRSTRQEENRRKFLESRRQKTYADAGTLRDELPSARRAFATLTESVGQIFRSASKGEALNLERIKESVEPMIDSICRNPDACVWLARLKRENEYTYQHSVAVSVWAVALGRQLGLGREDLQSLAVGGLLFDIGKLQVDPALLASPRRFTGEALRPLHAHVDYGRAMLRDLSVNDDIVAMLEAHHERFDGTGYPKGLVAENIPVFARIAAVVDVFDAMTSHRSYGRAVSPSEAIRVLNDGRNTLFQAEVVDEFIQAIGVYPAGTLVMLSTGEVGAVVAEGRTRRLRPKIMLLLDAYKQPLTTMRTLDLRDTPTDAEGRPLSIVTSLAADAFGLDLSALAL